MFMGADIVVKIVMIGLAFASLLTWTICVAKLLELRHETRRVKKRIKVLATTSRWRMPSATCATAGRGVAPCSIGHSGSRAVGCGH